MEINMLPVNNGDCIHIRFCSLDRWYNIVIDSGPGSCAPKFRTLLDRIRNNGELVDLLCFTHIDDDHIKAAQNVFSERTFDSSHIQMVWMNLPETVVGEPAAHLDYYQTSVSTASQLWLAIKDKKVSCQTKVMEGDIMLLGDVTVAVLLPTQQILSRFEGAWASETAELQRRGKYLLTSSNRKDSSPFNAASITFVLSYNDKKLLFTGDAHVDDLLDATQTFPAFSLVKLPHHGSIANIDMKLLEKLKCSQFMISTDQRTYRPSQETFDLLAEYGCRYGQCFAYGNYPWSRIEVPRDGLEIVTLHGRANPVLLEDDIELFTED